MSSITQDVAKDPPSSSPSPPPRKLYTSLWLITLLSLGIAYQISRSYNALQSELGTWGCRMSWMSPNYIKMDGPRREGMGGLEDKYGLWLYREGGLQGHETTGQPVLFIPGNAGSSKQVRSIASSAAHQYFESRSNEVEDSFRLRSGVPEVEEWKELDFYTVDFNEEFSAFHSASIQDQAHYVAHSIRYIISRYPSPRSIILIGHSMGGIVARLSLTLVQSGYDDPRDDISNLVAAIITMSTPHAMPPVSIDYGMEKLYNDINAYWEQNAQVPVLVSICGGTADTQISSDACVLPKYSGEPDRGTFSVFTTGIHGIWTGVDHQAMVWCDQIRSRVARVALGMHAILHKKGKEDGRAGMEDVLRKELLGEVPPAVLRPSSPSRPWKETRATTTLSPRHPVIKGHDHESYIVECPAVEMGGCTIQLLGEFRNSDIGPNGMPHLEIFTKKQAGDGNQNTWVQADLDTIEMLPPSASFSAPVPDQAFPLPGEGVQANAGMTFVQLGFYGSLRVDADEGSWAVVGMTSDAGHQGWKPVRRRWQFDQLDHSLLAHRLRLDKQHAKQCSQLLSPIIRHTADPSHTLSETHESRYHPRANVSILLHSHTAAAPFISSSSSSAYTVEVFQDPSDMCWIDKAYLSIDWKTTPGLLVLRYRTVLVAWAVGWIALAWARQLRTFRKTGTYPIFSNALASLAGREMVVVVMAVVGFGALQCSPISATIPYRSEQYLLGNTSGVLVPLAIPVALLALGLVWLSLLALSASIWCWSATMGKLSRSTRIVPNDAHLLAKQRVIGLLCLFTLLWIFVPYQFAFVIVFLVQYSTTAWSCEHIEYQPNLSLLLMMLWMLPLNATTVLVWVRGIAVDWKHAFRFGSHWGLIGVAGFALLCEGSASGRSFLRRDSRMSEAASIALAIFSFLLGPRHTYGIYMVGNVLAITLLVQMYRSPSGR